ncbi:MAG: hypothetical protein AB1847_15410 [bacterium]
MIRKYKNVKVKIHEINLLSYFFKYTPGVEADSEVNGFAEENHVFSLLTENRRKELKKSPLP